MVRPRRGLMVGVALATLLACSSDPELEAPPPSGPGANAPEPDAPDASPSADASLPEGEGGAVPVTPPDACAGVTAACPTATTTEGAGLTPLDRCAFPIAGTASFTTAPPLVAALEGVAKKANVATILGDLNRTAVRVAAGDVPGNPAGVALAFRWNAEDAGSTTWIPQGLTGSADASGGAGLVAGKRVLVASFYNADKGVRVAFLDITNPDAPKYRLVLLVEPTGSAGAPSFAPIRIHAGGMAWYGDRLYVADTSRGFRVFDVSRALEVATDVDAIGCTGGVCRGGLYKYVLPQLGAYRHGSSCKPIFSFVSLDRTTSPPSLLSGEYCSGSACDGPLAGRVMRWPLGADGLLAAGTSWPSEAFLMGQRQVQGAMSRQGLYFLSSSAPAASGGALYRVKGNKSATSTWVDFPEDLMLDEANGLVWSLSEASGQDRVVLGARLASYPAP